MSDWVVSVIRTAVPVVVGAVISWLLAHWAWADFTSYQDQVSLWLTGVCITGYYALARWLEQRYPWAGFLLGVPRRPTYVAPAANPQARRADARP